MVLSLEWSAPSKACYSERNQSCSSSAPSSLEVACLYRNHILPRLHPAQRTWSATSRFSWALSLLLSQNRRQSFGHTASSCKHTRLAFAWSVASPRCHCFEFLPASAPAANASPSCCSSQKHWLLVQTSTPLSRITLPGLRHFDWNLLRGCSAAWKYRLSVIAHDFWYSCASFVERSPLYVDQWFLWSQLCWGHSSF